MVIDSEMLYGKKIFAEEIFANAGHNEFLLK